MKRLVQRARLLVQASWWTHMAASRVRRHLAGQKLEDLVVRPPPVLPPGARRVVVAVLRIRRDTCLVRSAVLQAWDSAHGLQRDIVIGVTAPSQGFRAHAWLEGETGQAFGFQQLARHPPPARAPATRAGPPE